MLISFTTESDERYRITDRWKPSQNLPDSLPSGYKPVFHFHVDGPSGTVGQFYLAQKNGREGEFLFHPEFIHRDHISLILNRSMELCMDLLMADDQSKLMQVSVIWAEMLIHAKDFEISGDWLVWKPNHRQSARRWVDG